MHLKDFLCLLVSLLKFIILSNKSNVACLLNKDFNRPAETDYLLGDATKAKEELNWKPQVNFNTLIEMMVKKDLDRVENDVYGF